MKQPRNDLSVYVHYVSFNSEAWLKTSIESVLAQDGFELGDNLFISVTDNASSDSTSEVLKALKDKITVNYNNVNLGFCAAHNQGVSAFLKTDCDFMLIMNPDVALSPDCLKELCVAAGSEAQVGLVAPLLYRANKDLSPLEPKIVDAAGMYMTCSLRHFDYGSGKEADDAVSISREVFGVSGACLLIKRAAIAELSFRGKRYEEDLGRVYPELVAGLSERTQLFDEAFFAYREDADLAWRAQLMGWSIRFTPLACGYHVRVVTPERRKALPDKLNALGVKNRFLLQFNNLSLKGPWLCILMGVLFRNIVVVLGVLLAERSSFSALREALYLRRRALERRSYVFSRARKKPVSVQQSFI